MAYIPGASGQAYSLGLNRKIQDTQGDLMRKARSLSRHQSKRGIFGKIGGMLGSVALPALLGGTMGPAGMLLAKAAGSGLGTFLGGKAAGSGPSVDQSDEGLLGSQYKMLQDIKGGQDQDLIGASFGAGMGSLASGLTSAAGQKLLGDKLKSVFGKRMAGKTGISGFEGTPMKSVFGLDPTGAERLSPGMQSFSPSSRAGMAGYSGFTQPSQSFSFGQTGGGSEELAQFVQPDKDPTSYIDRYMNEKKYKKWFDKNYGDKYANIAEAVGGDVSDIQRLSPQSYKNTFGLNAIPQMFEEGDFRNPLRSSKWFTPKSGSELSGMQERLRGMAGEGGLFDPETGDPIELTGESMSGRMNEGVGGLLGSLFNPFHETEREAPRSRLTGLTIGDSFDPDLEEIGKQDSIEQYLQSLQGMQMGGMTGVSNPLPYQVGGLSESVEGFDSPMVDMDRILAMSKIRKGMSPESREKVDLGQASIVPPRRRSYGDRVLERNRNLREQHGDMDFSDIMGKYSSDQLIDMIPGYQMGGMGGMPGRRMPQMMGQSMGRMPQMGGPMPQMPQKPIAPIGRPTPYNIGGSVSNQPLSYQMGGILKYKRSPFA